METREDVIKQLERKWVVSDYFVELLDNLKEKKSYKYPDSIFYVDKDTEEVYMEHDKKYILINYDKIWKVFKSKYYRNYEEIRELIKELVGEHMNLWDVTPALFILQQFNRWKNI